jgi:hypothetical protein
MIVRLGSVAFKGLDGRELTVTTSIEKETAKAILLRKETFGKTSKFWIPKSICSLSDKMIEIPDWFCEKEGVR